MKIAVMGAGAVGCYYGGMLARAGHEVTLIARAHHATAINTSGLLLETQAFTERVRVAASTDASAADGAQWVLFCVKSTDTESAGRALAPHLAEGAVVLSLQNGRTTPSACRRPLATPSSRPWCMWLPRWRGRAMCGTTGAASW